MNKKLLVSVFLCLFVFSLGMLAQEKRGKTKSFFMKEAKEGQFYEFLLRADGWGGIWEYEVPREDAGELHEKKSEIFNVGHVESSKKTDVIFFDLGTYFVFDCWHDYYNYRLVTTAIELILSSDALSEYEVIANASCIFSKYEWMEDDIEANERHMLHDRFPLWRDRVDWWLVVYKGTNNEVPEEERIPIINGFIDNGFNVGYRIGVRFSGVYWIKYNWIGLEVSGISK